MKSQIDELMANLGAQKEKLSQQKMEHETEVSTFPSALASRGALHVLTQSVRQSWLWLNKYVQVCRMTRESENNVLILLNQVIS